MYPVIGLAGAAFVFSILLTPLFRNVFLRLGVVDYPDSRKIHARPIPRIGGLPIAISLLAAYGLFLLFPNPYGISQSGEFIKVCRVLPAAAAVFLTGLLDDLFGMKPWQKILGQLVAAGWAYVMGVRIVGVGGHSTELWWSVPLTLFWLIFCTNAFNLIDGVDGLASGVGIVASLTTLIAAIWFGHMPLAIATAPLVGALLGFLRYNSNPASIFLGDSGSLTIGFLLGSYSVIWSHKSTTLIGLMAPIMAVSLPLLEVCLSVTRRFLSRRPLFSPDREHIHHRLLDQGLSHRAVAFVLCGVSGVAACLALLQTQVAYQFSGVIVLVFCGLTLFGVQYLRYAEFELACDLFFAGALRSVISSNLALSTCQRRIRYARNFDECWSAIRDVSHRFEFAYVRLQVGGTVRESRFGEVNAERCWTTSLKLNRSASITLGRECRGSSVRNESGNGSPIRKGGMFSNRASGRGISGSFGISSLMDVLGEVLAKKLDELQIDGASLNGFGSNKIPSMTLTSIDKSPSFAAAYEGDSSRGSNSRGAASGQ